MEQVLQSDTVTETARKIYEGFEVNQSCKVEGFLTQEGELLTRGEKVIEILTDMDRKENVSVSGLRRKRVKPPNSIGDFVAQKMFIWKLVDTHKYTIWRRQ